jgi:hypothetical protein
MFGLVKIKLLVWLSIILISIRVVFLFFFPDVISFFFLDELIALLQVVFVLKLTWVDVIVCLLIVVSEIIFIGIVHNIIG